MLIFGTREKITRLLTTVLDCGHCGNHGAHALDKVVNRFTLFFIPVFPFSTKYVLVCAFCGIAQKLSKEQAQQLQAGN